MTENKTFFKDKFEEAVEELKIYNNRKTGFDNLDAVQMMAPGLYVIGGLPALGKTTFAWQLLNMMAERGETCIYCSYEMGTLELFTKSVTAEMFQIDPDTSLTAAQILRGGRSETLSLALEVLRNKKSDMNVLELRDEPIDELLKQLRKIIVGLEHSPVVCLDYLQIIPHDNDNVKAGVDSVVRKLKVFQRETNTTFIVVSSFNRVNYLQTVNYESFKESGNIEYTADVVWGLQLECMNNLKKDINAAREQIEQAKRDNPRRIQLRCLKNRKGMNYDCYFDYYAAHDYFVERQGPSQETSQQATSQFPAQDDDDDWK